MEEALCTIRESNRNILNINRRRLRDEETDIHRALVTLCTSSENVIGIANKLKTKAPVTVTELRNLKNAIIDDVKNIDVVMNTHGALRGLVRELSGHNERKQCEAAGCCCNLALGNSKTCAIVAKAAGPYLIAALNNLCTEFVVTCTWALGNLAGCGAKTCELLIAQGVIGKLTDQLSVLNRDLSDAAIEALIQVTYQLKDDFSSKHLNGILSKLQELPITAVTLNLLFILSCHKDFTVDHVRLVYIEKFLESFYNALRTFDNENIESLLHLIRILANFNNINLYGEILNSFIINNTSVHLGESLNNIELHENLFWLLGNMFKLCSGHEFFGRLIK